MLNYKVTTDAASEPLTKTEVRMQLKNEGITADDDLLDIYIKAARQLVEQKTNTALLEKTITQTFNCFPVASAGNKYAAFELAVSPLSSVTSISYKDTDGDSNTIDSSNYDADTFSTPGKVAPKPTYTWPTDVYDGVNAITVVYVAGHASTTLLPAPLREAMLLTIADWYRNRVDRPRKLSSNADWALKDYRVQKF
jgi:uncharacterized phiE125 gp8 family phage protein